MADRAPAHKTLAPTRSPPQRASSAPGNFTSAAYGGLGTSLQRHAGNAGAVALSNRLARAASPTVAAISPVGELQRDPPVIQAKLTISHPDDPFEKEADSVADKVMRMPDPEELCATRSPDYTKAPVHSVYRLCASCDDGLSKRTDIAKPADIGSAGQIDRMGSAAEVPQVTPTVVANIHAMQGGGSPLPAATRAFFEPRFGADFSHVRVHTGSRADATAKSINAKAFTVGADIAFAGGHYSPSSQEGQRLLAHELTHVVQQGNKISRSNLNIGKTTDTPNIQAAWYNFDIPFTNYQFDPSWEGIKTAAGVVKDTAEAGLDWIIEEIKSLVFSGIQWLSDQWDSIKEFASSAFSAARDSFTNIIGFIKSPLNFLADALMSLDGEVLARAWARFSSLVSAVANGFKVLTDNLLNGVNGIWGGINGFATGLLNRVSGMTNNFLFKKLPDALQQVAFDIVNRLKSFWKKINDGWTGLFNKLKTWVQGALDAVFSFVGNVLSFGINVVISGIIEFGKIVLFLKDLFSDPMKYVAILAKRSVQAFNGVESRFAGLVGQYFGSGKIAAPASATAVKVHRAPASEARTETKGSATWSEIGDGVAGMMRKKWNEFKSNPLSILTGLLMDMVLPIVGNVKDIIQLFSDIKNIVTSPFSAGSLEELWTSLLRILDIPILIYHTIVSILMRTLMLPLIVATFIPHPLVKGIAAVVGYGLLGAFVQAEGLNLGHKLLLLRTGATTKAQKEEAYNRIADSLIALAMTAVIMIIMLILHFIANVMKGVYQFVKGKVFSLEPKPVEAKSKGAGEAKGKGADSKTEKPSGHDLGTEKGKKVLGERATSDGKHEIKVTEEGIRRCSPSCPFLIQEIDAAVIENPILKEKLSPLRKQLEVAQGQVESARIEVERAPPKTAAEAQGKLKAAVEAAEDVADKVHSEMDKIIRDTPLPSGLLGNEYKTPEAAIGIKEGKANLVGRDPIKEPALREKGYRERHYYRDPQGKKWSVDVREVEGKPAYKQGKLSSGQEFD